MPSSTFANRCFAVLALILFQADRASADEFWKCTLTAFRVDGRVPLDITDPHGPAIFLRVQPGIVGIVVGTSTQISFPISEDNQKKLIGIAHFKQKSGETNDAEITLDKHSGRMRQTGHYSTTHYVQTGDCSEVSTNELPSEWLADVRKNAPEP